MAPRLRFWHDRGLGLGDVMRRSTIVLLALAGMLALSAVMTALDASVDAGLSGLPGPLSDFIDRVMMIGVMFAASALVLYLSRLRERTDDLEQAVERAADEGRAWRHQSRRFVDGLSRAIETQFSQWNLTAAEADVAGLLLKGASLREIAGLRRTSEATIRQQAQNVYRKSGLATRSELAAYFLEDLFALSEATLNNAADRARYDA
jgi:DNA-binding CsgD family transcriptional regulator